MGTRYPLGDGADPTKNHRTGPNRRAVSSCLAIYWISPEALSSRVNDRGGASQVGAPLNGRFVTRIELAQALSHLETERADWFTALWWVFGRNYSRADAADLLGLHETTLRERVTNGLNRLIDELWSDQLSPRSGAKSAHRSVSTETD